MPEHSFTMKALEALESQSKRYAVSDAKTPGLRLMVYPTGKKVFILNRKIKGRPERIKIGNFRDISIEQARKAASHYNSLIGAGANPYLQLQAERKEPTLMELYNIYYEAHAVPHTKRPDDNKKMMEYHIFPRIGAWKASAVSKEAMRNIHADIAIKRGKAVANRVVTIVSSVFNFAIRNDHFDGLNPCRAIKKFKTISRDRFLSSEELKTFFEALNEEEKYFRDFFSLLLYTGARKSNVCSMAWPDISFELRQWRISYEHAKNGDVNIINLSEAALAILKNRYLENRRVAFSLYVFPGEGANGHLIDPKRAFARLKKRMRISNFRMHDLRRTLGSYLALNGASLLTIASALNHKDQRSTAIYARLTQGHVLEAVNNATDRMASLSKI
jgi:integrase